MDAFHFNRNDHFDIGATDHEHPPGAAAEGLVNLMRENHWSANPGVGHDHGLAALYERTAADVPKLGQSSHDYFHSTARLPGGLHGPPPPQPRGAWMESTGTGETAAGLIRSLRAKDLRARGPASPSQ